MTTRLDLSADDIATLVGQAPPPVAALLLALLDVAAQQEQTITEQAATIERLSSRVEELEAAQSRTSRNSHQPPSSDGLKKQPRSLRARSGKAPGGQPGHPGQTLRFAEQPDQTIVHQPAHCAGCGASLAGVPAQRTERRQVVDLPPLALVVVEHQAATICCPTCQHCTSGSFPPEAPQPLQYGPRLAALGVYLRTYQLVPSARTQELLADLFGAAPSEGTLDTWLATAARTLEPLVEQIRVALTQAPVAHFDETGCYVEDKRYWLHVACTARLTYYAVQRQRGQGGSAAAGVLPTFAGVAVHDAYASYWTFGCAHALCNAHLLRELLFVQERTGQAWAADLAALLRELLAATQAAREAGAAALPTEQVHTAQERYRALVAAGLALNPVVARPAEQARGRAKQSAATNLLLRLREHEAEVLRFATDLRVPFDNNAAERDLRMMKVQQKISGRFRRQAGATAFCRIRSYIATLRKQAMHVFSALEQVFRGTPPLPDLAT